MQLLKTSLLILSVSGAITVMAQPVNIGVQAGQKFKVESTTKMNTSAEVMGQTMETVVDNKSTTVYDIKTIGADGINLTATITKMAVNTTSMGQEMSFDSEKPDNSGPMADMIGPKINKAKAITLDTKGSITKQDETEDEGGGAMMGLGSGRSSSTELFIPALVGRELKAGESFTDISSFKKDKYSSRDSGTYKITAIENGVASISYVGTQWVEAVMEQQGMEMNTNSTNSIKSEMQIDIRTGMVMMKATVVESNVSVEVAGMSIPATGKTISTTTVTPAGN